MTNNANRAFWGSNHAARSLYNKEEKQVRARRENSFYICGKFIESIHPRMKAVTELARLRKISVPVLMETRGLSSAHV